MQTRKEWRSAWVLVALHTFMAQVLYAPMVTTDTTPMLARRTDSTARIGSWEEFSSVRARGTTDSTDAEGSALIAGDSAAAVLDSMVAETGSMAVVGAVSVAEVDLGGDSPAAAPAEDLLVEVLDEDPAVVSEEDPWAEDSTAADPTAVAATGNCRTLIRARNKTAGSVMLPAVFLYRRPVNLSADSFTRRLGRSALKTKINKVESFVF